MARPLGPHPGTSWLENTFWGARITIENQDKTDVKDYNVWWGARVGPEFTEAWPGYQGATSYVGIWIFQGGSKYFKLVREKDTPPQSYSWFIQAEADSVGDYAYLKWELENDTHEFVPPDFSVVLENTGTGFEQNLRAKENRHVILPFNATLYVDNAVDILSIENLDPLTGGAGDNLRLKVTVKNTGRYTDNYRVWCDGGVPDPENWTGALAPGDNKFVILTTILPGGTENIIICADGYYADDSGYLTATGPLVRKVDVKIIPDRDNGPPGRALEYTVTVKNMGMVIDNYSLEASDNENWGLALDDDLLENVAGGENKMTTLTVTIPDNAPSGTEDNITVTVTSQSDNTVENSASCIAHIVLIKSMEVTISPDESSGPLGEMLTYTVTVTNTGNVSDNYSLEVSDNAGWQLRLDDGLLTIPAGENRETMLRVTLPNNATGSARDNVTVTATSVENENVSDNDSCIAHVENVFRVEVSISPPWQEGKNNENLYYTITVHNRGNIPDNFHLSHIPNGWPDITIVPDQVGPLPPFNGTENVALIVRVPENVPGGTEKEIVIIAESERSDAVDNDNAIARVVIFHGVEVSISPDENSAEPSNTLEYTVTVTNTGSVNDNYLLSWDDSASWGDNIWLSDNLVLVENHGKSTATLYVHIPTYVQGYTDNITVTATLAENENMSDNASCLAHMTIVRRVEVSISPAEGEEVPGEALSYTVEIINSGSVADDYSLIVSDNAGWALSLSEDSVENVSPGENRTVTLTVTVPDNSAPGTVDEITVTATSQENTAVSTSASCIGRALVLRRVEITISPDYRSGSPGDTLSYTVTVTNTGQVADDYNLSVSASAGWFPNIEPSSLALEPGQSAEATLSVDIPPDVNKGDTGIMEVRAVSREDWEIQDADTCRAVVGQAREEEGGELSIPWLEVILVAALIGGVVFAAGYLTSRRGKGSRHRVLRA